MICRNCGTQIAEKALICYRCGTATEEPRVRPPAERRSSGSQGPILLALLVLVVAALVMGQVTTGELPREVSYGLGALAAVALGWRLWLRRRGRTRLR
jgi:hypothetical protein